MGIGHIGGEDQREGADQRIDADLGQQTREDGRDRKGRGVVARGQPEKQREECGLDPEGHDEHHRDDQEKPLVFDLLHRAMQIGHVQRPGQTIKQADPRQEQDRRDQVERDVFDAAIKLFLLAAQNQQAKGRDQHHLEPDIEVEDIAGQKRAADTGQQHLEQRVIAQPFLARVNIAKRIDRDGQTGNAGDHHHHRRQQVSDQRDAEGRGPLAHLRRDHALLQHFDHQDGRCQKQRSGPCHRQPAAKR